GYGLPLVTILLVRCSSDIRPPQRPATGPHARDNLDSPSYLGNRRHHELVGTCERRPVAPQLMTSCGVRSEKTAGRSRLLPRSSSSAQGVPVACAARPCRRARVGAPWHP